MYCTVYTYTILSFVCKCMGPAHHSHHHRYHHHHHHHHQPFGSSFKLCAQSFTVPCPLDHACLGVCGLRTSWLVALGADAGGALGRLCQSLWRPSRSTDLPLVHMRARVLCWWTSSSWMRSLFRCLVVDASGRLCYGCCHRLRGCGHHPFRCLVVDASFDSALDVLDVLCHCCACPQSWW